MNTLTCPVCKNQLDVSDIFKEKFFFLCPQCRNIIQAEMRCVPWGKILPPSAQHRRRVECPYCGQHHAIETDINGHNLICQNCKKKFAVPEEWPDDGN